MVGLTEQVNLRLLWIGDMMRSCSLYILNFTQVFEDWLLEFLERDLGQVLCIVREVERVYVKPDNNSCHLTIWRVLEIVDVLLLPIEGKHVLIRPADLLEALLVSAS